MTTVLLVAVPWLVSVPLVLVEGVRISRGTDGSARAALPGEQGRPARPFFPITDPEDPNR